jgi:ligand-binding sensor domain-containing protein/two-component sensor histidine kinase
MIWESNKTANCLHRKCNDFLLFIISFLFFLHSSAQQNYFRFYSTGDGLPSNTVGCDPKKKPILKDKDGLIWMATFGGVSIYDGYHFRNFTAENGGVTDDIILNLFKKSDDEIWVVESVGTEVFVNRKRIKFIPILGYQLSHYLLTHDGRVLVARDGFIFEIKDYKPQPVTTFPIDIARMYEAGNYFLIQGYLTDSLYITDKSFQKIIARQKGRIFEDNNHRYWLFDSQFYLLDTSALQKGIFRLLPPPAPMNKIKFKGKQITDFLPDSDGFFWVIIENEKGVIRIDSEGDKKHIDITANSLMEDADRNIWMAGDAGFSKFYNKYNDFFTTEEGLSSDYINGIAEDERTGSAWVVHKKGFSCIYQNHIFNFPFPNHPSIWPLIKIQGDSLWITNNGLFLYKMVYNIAPHIRLLKKWEPGWRPESHVDYTTLPQSDDTGNIFFNRYEYGLFQLKDNGKMQKVHEAGVTSFFIDGDELWISPIRVTIGDLKSDLEKWKMIRTKDSIYLQLLNRYPNFAVGPITAITKDAAGNFWIGTSYLGMMKLERQENDSFIVRNYNSRQGLMNPWVIKISFNRQGDIFAGTMGGIFQLHLKGDSTYFENLSTRFGDVYATWDHVQDAKGNFWLATPVGVVHVRNDLFKKTPAPKVFFTQLLKNNQPDSSLFSSTINIFSFKENNLTFEFSSNSFRNEAKVLYSYQLEKGDHSSQWSVPQPIHTVSLVSLSPGSYTLKVKAMTGENLWSEEPAVYSFIINPPFWATWWFRLLIITVVAAVIYFLYRFRIKQLKKVMAVRMKISRDLHDEIGSTLSGIGIISEMAKYQLENKKQDEVIKSLDKISVNTSETLGKMSDIIWTINPQNDSFEKIISRLESYAKSIAGPLGIQLHFETGEDAKQIKLSMQQRNNIYLICKEAINNAIKYSGSQHLFFVIEKNDHHVHISVKDDGKGFNLESQYEGNGLKNMQARAKEIKAKLFFDSEKDRGTSVELLLNIT